MCMAAGPYGTRVGMDDTVAFYYFLFLSLFYTSFLCEGGRGREFLRYFFVCARVGLSCR